MKFPNELNNP